MRPHVVHWLAGFLPSGAAQVIAPTWFTCVGLAGVLCLFVLSAIARRDRIPTRVVAGIVLWCYVAAVIAGIVIPMTIDMLEHVAATGELRVRWAGMTSFWGYLAGFVAVVAACRVNRIPLARLGDLAAGPMGLALFCARIGCFLAGCDYGKVTSLPWAVRFPAGSPAWTDHLRAGLLPPEHAESLPVHPTQLYEAGLGLLMLALGLVLLRRRPATNGRVFLACAALYAIGRIAIETVRGDAGRGVYGGLSSGQIFSLVVLAAVGATWLSTRRRAVGVAIAAGALALVLAEPHEAAAQPQQPQRPQSAPAPAPAPAPSQPPPPQQPYPQPYPYPYPPQQPYPYPPPQQPYPYPPPQQPYPYPPPQPYPYPPPQQPTYAPPPPQEPEDTGAPAPIEVGLLAGIAVPVNRRADQVPALAGVSVSVGYDIGSVGLWLDFDGYTNTEASHRSGLASAGLMHASGRWSYGARFGLGFTTVTFKDTAFGSSTGSLARLEALAEYRIGPAWTAWARLAPMDLVTSADLGGPILTYQMRVGLAYRFGTAPRPAPAPPPPPAAPPRAAPPPPAAPPAPASAAPPPLPTPRSQP